MGEKVYGFYNKNAMVSNRYEDTIEVTESKLVSVRLASESVDLKELKRKLKEQIVFSKKVIAEDSGNGYAENTADAMIEFCEDLIEWAEKEAKKK